MPVKYADYTGGFFLSRLCFVLLALAMMPVGASAGVVSIKAGDPYKAVVAELGEPNGKMQNGDRVTLFYDIGSVTLRAGTVVDVAINKRSVERVKVRKEKEAFEAQQHESGLVEFRGQWVKEATRKKIIMREKKEERRKARHQFPPNHVVFGVPCLLDVTVKDRYTPAEGLPEKGAYHYNVYVPKDYYKKPRTQFPCIFIASPSGDAQLQELDSFVQQNNCFAVMLVESSNEAGWPVMAGNFVAAYDDVLKRFRINSAYCVGTGFSGGARGMTLFAGLRPLSGLLLQGAGAWWTDDGYQFGFLKENENLPVYVLFGNDDRNRNEVKTIKKHFRNYRIEFFNGGHIWAPAEFVEEGLQWLQQQGALPY